MGAVGITNAIGVIARSAGLVLLAIALLTADTANDISAKGTHPPLRNEPAPIKREAITLSGTCTSAMVARSGKATTHDERGVVCISPPPSRTPNRVDPQIHKPTGSAT